MPFFLVLAVLAGFFGGAHEAGAAPAPPTPSTFDIRQDFDLTKVADMPGASACGFFAARLNANGRVHYVYMTDARLYYGVEGSGTDPIVISAGSVACADVDLAFEPDGSAVVGWIDLRNAYTSLDGSGAGWDLFVASEDSGWQETLVTASSNQRVQTFRMEVDSRGTIHLVYARFTLAQHPYNPALFYANSRQWQEVAVSGPSVWSTPGLAIDSKGRVHVAWSYSGDLENVWYATDANGWTNVRVDQDQSSNWWDDRRDPSLAIDSKDTVHIIWDDYRNVDTTWTLYPNRAEIWHASSANGWVNSELVLPDDAAPARTKMYPILTIDANDRWHVVWTEWNDNGNLYYANSTDWNRAIKFTNESTLYGYAEIPSPHPVDARNGRLIVLFSDSRTGYPVLWRKDDWDFGPDISPPVVGPLANRTFGITAGGRLQAIGSWDNDRIASYGWRLAGPEVVVAAGYDAYVNFTQPGRYTGTLTIRDPVGYEASTNFTLDVLPEPSTTGWIVDKRLADVPGAFGRLTIFPWDGTASLVTYLWGGLYLRLGAYGDVLAQYSLTPSAIRETAAFDVSGNLHTVGFNSATNQLEYTKSSGTGLNLIPPTTLALGGLLPQHPDLTFAQGALWLAWMDQRDGNFEIYLASLDVNGNVRREPVRISNNSQTSDQPILAATGSGLWIVWYDDREFTTGVYASRLNLTTETFDVQEMRLGDGVAWDGKALRDGGLAYLAGVPWGEPYVARVDASGAPTAPNAWVSFDDGRGAIFGGLALDSNDAAHVVWWDFANVSMLRYAKVSPDGRVEPLGGMRIHDIHGDAFPSMSIAMGPDGDARIVYTDGTFYAASLYVAVRDPVPPVARFSVKGTIRAGAAIELDGSGSTDNAGIGSYAWRVSNGSGETVYSGAIVTVRLPAGAYTVTLEVRDLAGNPANVSQDLTIAPDTTPPVAVITGPSSVVEGQQVTFDGLASSDDGAIMSYRWWVTGPATASGSGDTFYVVFPIPATYTVHLEVTDFGGNEASAELVVQVRDPNPPTVVASVPTQVYEGTDVSFDASGSTDDSGIGSVVWSIRDAHGTEVARLDGSVVHYRFDFAGSYQVVVTVTDIWGNANSRTITVSVLPRALDPTYRLWVGLGLTGGGAFAGGGFAILVERLRRSRRKREP